MFAVRAIDDVPQVAPVTNSWLNAYAVDIYKHQVDHTYDPVLNLTPIGQFHPQ